MEKITSRDNPLIKHIAKLACDLSYRREHNLMVCSGAKMLSEAFNAGIEPMHILTTGVCGATPSQTRIVEIPEQLIGSVSPLETPQDIVFTVPIPENVPESVTGGIILDRIQDPGNVGSIIRTARAFGIPSVILTDGCADISNPKTLRATMGAVFSQKIIRGSQEQIWALVKDRKVYTTGMNSGALDVKGAGLTKNSFVLIGNEGRGLSDYWLSKGLEMITIPIEFESLGAAAAAAIIMWEMKQC